MSDNVIDFAAIGDGGAYEGLTCSCGSAWFTVQAVALNQEAHVTAWAAPLTCRECGCVRVAGAWVKPNLAVADGGDAPTDADSGAALIIPWSEIRETSGRKE